ncbi:MAG: hypothetical protein ABI759_10925 [Candidatus Solibacter sp.]
MVADARSRLLTGLTPDSFDIGFDDGVHAAVHLVPRSKGDGLGQATGSYVIDDLKV